MYITKKYRDLCWWIKNIYNHEDKVDIGRNNHLPILKKIHNNLQGFTDAEYFNFNLANNDRSEYISYKERFQLEFVNGRFAPILGEKVMFERIFGSVINVPHIYCWVRNHKFIGLNGEKEEINIVNILKRDAIIIAKPTRSIGGGNGIHSIRYEQDSYFIDETNYALDDFLNMLRNMEEYIFVQNIYSHRYSSSINPESTNTIRVVTAINHNMSIGNQIEVLLAFHRFGTKVTKPVDNLSSGGLFAAIDEDSGELSYAKTLLNISKEYDKHPDTGAQIKGVIVPNWEYLISTLKKWHSYFPYYDFFAWDVVMDPKGKIFVLEINRGCDLSIQSIKPLKQDKLGKYMRERGLLK